MIELTLCALEQAARVIVFVAFAHSRNNQAARQICGDEYVLLWLPRATDIQGISFLAIRLETPSKFALRYE